jgi:hypothetical protein
MSSTLTLPATVHQSRWGYHPCSQEDFKKLKQTHRALLRLHQDAKRYIRWANKTVYRTEHPPIGAIIGDFLTENGLHYSNLETDQEKCKKWFGLGFRRYKGRNLYLHILNEYRNARTPRATQEEVRPLDLPPDLWDFIEKANQYYQ